MDDYKGQLWYSDQDTTKNLEISNQDTTIFQKAEIVETLENNQYKIRILNNDETIVADFSQLQKANPTSFDGCNDMASLTYLNEPSVLNNLKIRYQDDKIYTHSGLFLVTVNPYKNINIYNDSYISMYSDSNAENKNDDSIIKSKPHIFGTAHEAYTNLIKNKKNQSILVTGESGAGKTENTKKVIQYILSVSTNSNNKENALILENKILQANPILESFGNATTVRNLNSSRFGKFVKIQIDNQKNELFGAHIDWYLLEKSRVIYQDKNERNYHVFYQLLKGAPTELLDRLLLTNKSLNSYEYLKNGITNPVISINDKLEFENLMKAFKTINFSDEEIFNIFKILSIILHLGNIKFRNSDQDTKQAVLDEGSDEIIEKISKLLSVPSNNFKQSFLNSKIKVGREIVNQQRTAVQAKFAIDALAKSLYEKLFQYLVDKINSNFSNNDSTSEDPFNDNTNYIGILDIAGFEIFEKNSFEQLCINYTNEKLQQFFNHHMFELEQKEYLKENISWKYIDFGNELKPTIELIEGSSNDKRKTNIFSILNEECVVPKGNDKSFIEKLFQNLENKEKNTDKSKLSFKPNKIRDGFIIKHYAGSVDYSIDGWLDKNKDPLSSTMIELLSNSSDDFINIIFQDSEDLNLTDSPIKGSPRKKTGMFRTVAQRHKEQLTSLMDQLSKTYPHFVRCILPNNEKKPNIFSDSIVLHQLRCNGVLEGIRIARSGYPNRIDFKTFATKYNILISNNLKFTSDYRHLSELILNELKLDKEIYKIGLTKLFFRNGVLASIEKKKDEILSGIFTNFNSVVKGMLFRSNFQVKLQRLRASKVLLNNFSEYSRLNEDPWFKLIKTLKPRLDDSSMIELQYTSKISQLESKIKDLLSEIENHSSDKAKIFSKIEVLENELTANKSIIDEKNSELDDSNKKLVGLENEFTKIKELYDENVNILASRDTELENLSKVNINSIEKLELENKELLENKAKLEKKIEAENKSNVLLKNELASLKSILDKNEMELTSLKIEKKSKHNDIHKKLTDLQVKSNEVNNENKSLKSELDEKSNKLILKTNELNKLQKIYDSVIDEYNALKEMKKDYDSKKTAYDQSEKLKLKYKEQKRDLVQTKSLLEQKIKDEIEFSEGRQQYQKELQETKNIINDLKSELELQKKFYQDTENKLEHAKLETEIAIKEKKFLQSENSQLKLQLRIKNPFEAELNQIEYNNKSKGLDPEFHKLKDDLRILQTRVSSEVEENRKLKAILKKNGIDFKSMGAVLNSNDYVLSNTNESGNIHIFEDENSEVLILKENLLREKEANRRLEKHNVQLKKDLMNYKSKTNLNLVESNEDYKYKYQMSQIELEELNEKIEVLKKQSKKNNARALRENSLIENSVVPQQFDDPSNVKLKHENLRLSSMVNEMKTKLGRFESGNSNRYDQEEEIIQLRHNLQAVTLKNNALEANSQLYKTRSEDYFNKLSKMEVELNASLRERKKLSDDILIYKDKLKRMNLSNEEFENQIQNYQQKIRELNKQISDKDLKIDELVSSCESLTDKFKNSEELRKSFHSSHRDHQESEINRLNNELTKSLNKETEFNKLLRGLNMQLENSKKEINSIKFNNNELFREKKSLTKSLNECIFKNEGLLAEVKENILKVQNLSQQVNVLKVTNNDLLKERNDLLTSKRLLEEKLNSITVQFDQHLSKVRDDANNAVIVEQLSEKLRISETANQKILKDLSEYKENFETVSKQLQELKVDHLKTIEESKELAKFNSSLLKKLDDNSKEYNQKIDSQDTHWSKRINELEDRLLETKSLQRNEQHRLENLKRTIEDLRIRNEDLERYKRRSDDEIKKLEHNLESLDQKYHLLAQRETEAQIRCKRLGGECERYREMLSSQI